MTKLHPWFTMVLLVLLTSVGLASSAQAHGRGFNVKVYGYVTMQQPDGSWEGVPGVTVMIGSPYLRPTMTDEEGYYEGEVHLQTEHPENVFVIPCSEMGGWEKDLCPPQYRSKYIFDPSSYSTYYTGEGAFSELEVSFTARPICKVHLHLPLILNLPSDN